METKFKPGDRVVAVTSGRCSTFPIGMTGTVLNYDETIFVCRPIVTILFDHNNKREAWHDYRFELIEKTEINA